MSENGVKWEYYDAYDEICNRYLPDYGEGETKATQIATAVNKIIYKWYNDGDVYDNTHFMRGWANDISDFANWLYENTDADEILERIEDVATAEEYEFLLKDMFDLLMKEDYLAQMNEIPKTGSVYDCSGPFEWDGDRVWDDDDEWDDEDEDEKF